MNDQEREFARRLGYDPLEHGDPVIMAGSYGRITHNEGGEFHMLTPGGTHMHAGLSWFQKLDEEGMQKLKGFEKAALEQESINGIPYDGKIARELWEPR